MEPEDPTEGTERHLFSRPGEKRILALFVVPMIGLQILVTLADALAPTLLTEHPLLLVAMNARIRNLVLASPSLDAWTFFVVACVRLLASDPLFFAFGRRYGDAGIRWVERKVGSSGIAERLEQWFRRAGYPMVAIAPNNLICVLAGAGGMSIGAFVTLNVVGTLVRLLLIRWLGDVFSDPILSFTDWISDNRVWLTALSIVVVGVLVWRGRRRGLGELESIDEVAAELEEIEGELEEEGEGRER